MGRVEASILKALTDLHPQHLDLINESHMHAVPKDSETHFKLVVVSDSFENLRLVRRHQIVYALLKEQLAGPVHAHALQTPPLIWQACAGLRPSRHRSPIERQRHEPHVQHNMPRS